eukprot:CAMPEP_0114235166 /NCGR_PEP_ID=MMETSP0058-20121206/6101_1 /TAXON_ID=36894 /ORGANISM="Pyramimonas parkeae, CCMP726" /LENGTH=97 /DNA_ID=CAMNT_0001346901 /DNA_START=283 /DNA_END=577 /DNA_ORIENTATION=+
MRSILAVSPTLIPLAADSAIPDQLANHRQMLSDPPVFVVEAPMHADASSCVGPSVHGLLQVPTLLLLERASRWTMHDYTRAPGQLRRIDLPVHTFVM